MVACTICNDPYTPDPRTPIGLCPECHRLNFHGAQPPLGWAEVNPVSLALSPREVQALVAYRARVRRQQEEG